jgi:hypothetical protein
MRKAIKQLGLVALLLVGTAGAARAQDATPVTTTPASAPAPHGKLQLMVSFLPMSLGTFKSAYGGMKQSLDAAFAPGVALSVSYEVVQGLSIGLAPQVLFNVKPKEDPITTNPEPAREVDAMLRIAYAYPILDTVALYGQVLPGYSLILPKVGDKPAGFVFAFDVGAIINLSQWNFVSLGGGYQWGFQSRTDVSRIMMDGMEVKREVKTDVKPNYYRVALGVGCRF